LGSKAASRSSSATTPRCKLQQTASREILYMRKCAADGEVFLQALSRGVCIDFLSMYPKEKVCESMFGLSVCLDACRYSFPSTPQPGLRSSVGRNISIRLSPRSRLTTGATLRRMVMSRSCLSIPRWRKQQAREPRIARSASPLSNHRRMIYRRMLWISAICIMK
jgi:hypothetical protein